MKDRGLVIPAPIGADGDDVTTWALPEGAIFRLGRGSVRDMAFSPDGQYFAVASAIGLWLYELPTLSPIALWDTERGMTGAISFSPDSQRIVTYTFSETIKIWDVQIGVCATEIEDPNKPQISPISNLVYSQDGQHIAAINRDSKIYIFCSHTGKLVRETIIETPYDVHSVSFSQI